MPPSSCISGMESESDSFWYVYFFCILRCCLVKELWELEVSCKNNVKGLDKLVRFRISVPLSFPIPARCAFGPSLYLYYRSICAAGQVNIGRSLLGVLHIIDTKARRKKIPMHMIDDFYRQHLKKLSAICFPRVFTDGPAYMFFVHLHSLGGKSPYSKKDIEDDVKTWVTDNKAFTYPDYVRRKNDKVFNLWNLNVDDSLFLSFDEYCSDVLRWSTSGGAPKANFLTQDFRTKWAWGMNAITDPSGRKLLEQQVP